MQMGIFVDAGMYTQRPHTDEDRLAGPVMWSMLSGKETDTTILASERSFGGWKRDGRIFKIDSGRSCAARGYRHLYIWTVSLQQLREKRGGEEGGSIELQPSLLNESTTVAISAPDCTIGKTFTCSITVPPCFSSSNGRKVKTGSYTCSR
ncbi:hypothetical protein K470DRAFT_92772 [Piedraia hortae CBS 480.64]|uniref:Uncharacterized protein n=1 Tax=Piedraia hortae CBS 480.64 TaxID=1314780 RepID=A0A6A7BYG0_9PEZI|nr:hypothetical protein K470DRAFT_92772 [Piedraia hortae CBS 480.64]